MILMLKNPQFSFPNSNRHKVNSDVPYIHKVKSRMLTIPSVLEEERD